MLEKLIKVYFYGLGISFAVGVFAGVYLYFHYGPEVASQKALEVLQYVGHQ